MSDFLFPAGFLWGAATAALQIEGASGRGATWWDDFCREHPERIHAAATPEIACDHVNRWQEDVALIAAMGHNAYRFSIAWPRVEAGGLDFYERLVDALLAAGIEPIATLYHWDLPSALARAGAWEARDTSLRFGDFAAAVAARLAGRVRWWMTLNEPGWSTLNGYVTGLHPPAKRDPKAAFQASAHVMLAHALAARALRATSPTARAGIALNLSPCRPATESEADARAAELADGFLNRWLLEAAVLGRFPDDVRARLAACGMDPELSDADRDLIARERVDALGVNYYYPHRVSADAPEDRFHINNSGDAREASHFAVKGAFRMVKAPAAAQTDWGWEIDPGGLEELLLRVQSLKPGLPQIVTENGIALIDEPDASGRVDDAPRIAFLRAHLEAISRAITQGASVRGYLMWSLMDNFSWLNGYRKRYGFLHVDRTTLARTRKTSSFWFEEIARRNKLPRVAP
jgi:6-phospho-beta-glucosidase